MDLRSLSWLVLLSVVLTALHPRDATSSPSPSATPTVTSSPTSLPIFPPSPTPTPTTHIQDSHPREVNVDGVTISDGGGGDSDEGDLSDKGYDDGDEYYSDDGDEYYSDDGDAYNDDSDEHVDEYDEYDATYESDTDDSDEDIFDDNASYEDDDDDNEDYDDIYDDNSYDDDMDDDVSESDDHIYDEYDDYDEHVSHENYDSAYDGTVQTYWRNDGDEDYDDEYDEDDYDSDDDDIDNDSNDMEDDVEDAEIIASDSDDDDDDNGDNNYDNSDSGEHRSSLEKRDNTDDPNAFKVDHKFQIAKLTKEGKGDEEGMVYLFLDDDYGNITPINITMNEINDENVLGKINDSDTKISIIQNSNKSKNIYNGSNDAVNNANHDKFDNDQNSNNETKISNNNGDDIIEMLGTNETILQNNNTIKSNDKNNIATNMYADKNDTAIKKNNTSSTNNIDKNKINEHFADINKNETTLQNSNTSSTNSSHELGPIGVSSPSTVVSSQPMNLSPSTDNSTMPTIVPGEGYVPQQETLIVLSDEQLRLLGDTSPSMEDIHQETNTPAYSKLDQHTGINTKNEKSTHNYAFHTSGITLWPTEAPKNLGPGTKESKEEHKQSSVEMTSEEVKQLLKQYGIVEGTGFEEEWEDRESESEETSEDQSNANKDSKILKYQKLIKDTLSPVPLSLMSTNPELTTLQTILISQNISRPSVVSSEISLSSNSTTSQIPLNSDPPSTVVSLNVTQSISQIPINSSLSNSTSPTNPQTTVSSVTSNYSSSLTTELSSNTTLFTSQNPSTPNTNIPQVPLESVQPTTQDPLNSDTTTDDGDSSSYLAAAYESIVSSPVMPAKERNAVGHLERLRRAVDRFGGLRAVQGSIAVHHIVKRQLRGDEACGVFSRRRRRDTRTHENSETSSNTDYYLTESLPVTVKLINYLEGESETSNFVEKGENNFRRRNIKETGEYEGRVRNKRGINNVGKRLENGNAGYRQLFNQYKRMCEFIAMAVFE